MTVKGRLQRPPVIMMGGDSIRTVSTGVCSIVGSKVPVPKDDLHGDLFDYPDLRGGMLVRACIFACIIVCNALLRTQRLALMFLTKAYRIVGMAALPVLAGVLPAHMKVIAAGRADQEYDGRIAAETDEDIYHVLWSCSLYDNIRSEMLSGVKVLQVGSIYYAVLVATQANFRRFVEYARAWHGLADRSEK
ncbi:hypothetical protein EVAR_17386_1 [Eumeta japonica]|uniref:Uncharacterized protein n=1 Tax=Eumeta variegata TaxID=151549 RepID=A0A4C1VD31_EUMVA|nr:hypothetical protein EVAR_17386_1 [Eumeta japonica]